MRWNAKRIALSVLVVLVAGIGILRGLDFPRQPLRDFLQVDAPQRCDGNFLLRGIKRHRLERRFFSQGVGDRTRQATFIRPVKLMFFF